MTEDDLQVITTRIPRKIVEYVENVAQQEHLDKATIYRKLLYQAVEHDRLERAIELFRKDEATLLKAAEVAGIPASVFVDELIKRKVNRGLGIEAFHEGMETLREFFKRD